ncbi:hypothetical protein EV426DRAFT_708560 [Tirmania nivea]|nr:hypothetical protein EV426DRAFT_708560 [Tirmania nivea]
MGNVRMVILSLLSLLVLSLLSTATPASAFSPDSHTYDLSAATHDFGSLSLLQSRQSDKLQLSNNGRCGDRSDEGNGWRCPATIEEQATLDGQGASADLRKLELKCCSAQGFCGGSAAHCGSGCQPRFGTCSPVLDNGSSELTCGPLYNNRSCPLPEQCCSENGYCGTGNDYCQSPQCLVGFGKCDASIVPSGRNTTWVDRSQYTRVRIQVNGENIDYGVNIFKCQNPGHVALTYDDGPYNFTSALLDILDEFHFKATFFITGVNKAKGPIDDPNLDWDKIIRRMYHEGHQVASHTWSHADLDKLNEWDRRNEMIKLEMALRNILGLIPTYMRPPYSSCSAQTGCLATMKSLGYYVINFDLDTQDYFHTTSSQIQLSKDVFSQKLKNTSIEKDSHLVIAHDISYQSAVNLTRFMVEIMKEGGWKGVTVGECLQVGGVGQGEAGWYRIAENETEKGQREGSARSEEVNGTGGSGQGNEKVDKGSDAMGRWEIWGLGRCVGIVVVIVGGWIVVGI